MTAEQERQRATQFGFASLLVWVVLGTLLEAAHGFKLAAYLDVPLRRELLRLAHAHGVGLSLVVLAYAARGVVDEGSRRHGQKLRAAALLMPTGFTLSVLAHAESDPGPAIVLVPIGALSLIVGLWGVLRSLPR